MSGWKRLGVVISILWLIGAPIYFHAPDQQIEREYEACISIAAKVDGEDWLAKLLADFSRLSLRGSAVQSGRDQENRNTRTKGRPKLVAQIGNSQGFREAGPTDTLV